MFKDHKISQLENGQQWQQNLISDKQVEIIDRDVQIESLQKENERLKLALQDASDSISSLINEYPNELWTHEEQQRWVNIGNDGIAAINNTLSQKGGK